MSDSTALDSFLDKWLARWPEWSVAEIFVPPPRRAAAVAWFSLLQEFEDAMNIAGDPLPADAKLAWWAEELRGWSNRRSRHPLGRRLEPHRAPWDRLADALPSLIEARAPAADGAAAFAILRGYGEAVAAVERAVLGAEPAPASLVAQTLAARLADSGVAALPGDVAAASDPQRLRIWASRLDADWPPARNAARERRIFDGFAHARLRRFARAGEATALPSRLRLLFDGWRFAQGG